MSLVESMQAQEQVEKKQGFDLGDLIVLIVSAFLFIITIYRTWHFLDSTIPSDFKIIAIAGLWGLDLGATCWAVVWMFYAANRFQNWTSVGMFVVDLIGMGLTSVIDSLMYSPSGAVIVPEALKTAAFWGVPAIILANIIATFCYHMFSERVLQARRERHAIAEMRAKEQERRIAALKKTLDLQDLRKTLTQRQEQLNEEQTLVSQKLGLDSLEQALQELRADRAPVDDAKNQIKARLQAQFGGDVARNHLHNGNGNANHQGELPNA